jgi:transcriptional regulator with XRE-family HTH domain
MNEMKKKSEKEKTAKEGVGLRFRKFREEIGRVQREMGEELNISQSTVANIERGKAFPNITYLHYFYHKYRLNINWLLTGRGQMFFQGKSVDKNYLELINLMQVPIIEQMIFAKLTEVKVVLKDEIEAFYKEREEDIDSG